MLLKWTLRAVLVAGLVTSSILVYAVEEDQIVSQAETVDDAISVYLSPRGQEYFYTNFEKILFKNGFSLRQGTFPGIDYVAEEVMDLDKIDPNSKTFKVLSDVRDIFRKWLIGLSLNNPRFKGSLKDVRYKARFSRFGLKVDHEATRRLEDEGIVLLFEIEVPEMQVTVGKVRGEDLENKFLGVFGMNNLQVGLQQANKPPLRQGCRPLKEPASTSRKASKPLKIQAPFHVKPGEAPGTVYARALDVKTNLNSVTLEADFDCPMLLPVVKIEINGHSMVLNQAQLENDLIQRQQEILPVLQNYLKASIEKEAPVAVNALIRKHLSKGLAETNTIKPPGVTAHIKPADMFKWGIVKNSLDVQNGFMRMKFAGFVEDPKAARTSSLSNELRAKSLPSLGTLDPKLYDMAIAVNQGIINRMIQLSFYRGYFSGSNSAGSSCMGPSKVRMIEMPQLHLDAAENPHHAKLHVKVEYSPSFKEKLAIRNKLNIEMDLNLKIEAHPTKGPRMAITGIDEESVKIDNEAIRFKKLFKDNVEDGVLESIRAINLDYQRCDEAIVDNLPIPPSVFGVPIGVKDLQSDRSGNLVLFLEYGARK